MPRPEAESRQETLAGLELTTEQVDLKLRLCLAWENILCSFEEDKRQALKR